MKTAVLALYGCVISMTFMMSGCASLDSAAPQKDQSQIQAQNERVEQDMDLQADRFSGPAASRHR